MTTTPLYIAVETRVREFDAKLLLACVAAEAGYDVWLGSQKIFQRKIEEMSPGIFFDKSVSIHKIQRWKRYQKFGFHIVAYDEEGLAPWNPDEYQRKRLFSNDLLAPLACFFTWGAWQTEFIGEKAPQQARKLFPAGHPRVDLTRPQLRGFYEPDVKRLREKYGRFLLVNTNFPLCNHFHGEDGVFRLFVESGKILDQPLETFYRNLQRFQQQLMEHFSDLIARLHERFPDKTIIVRPHPSENHDAWRQRLAAHQRVAVVHEGNIIPWLMAADATIHNSCMTGIEGYLLERPVFAFRPIQAPELENYLANALSEQVLSVEALIERLDQLDGGQPLEPDAEKRALAERYIVSLDAPLSCDRIIATLTQMSFKEHPLRTAFFRSGKRAKRWLRTSLMPRSASLPTHAPTPSRAGYQAQKFPDTPLEDVQEAVARLQRLTGRFAGMRVARIESNLFRLTAHDVH